MNRSSHAWSPITDLPDNWKESLVNAETFNLVRTWNERVRELREQKFYEDFQARLYRQWAIETGILEGQYSLSEGATTNLIKLGLDASLISHEDTDRPPEQVYAQIRDHHDAIMGVVQFLSGTRPLGTSYIKELHRVLTAHQETYVARDTLGNIVTRKLPKGKWKTLSNSVEHPDGTGFEYCPPEHVNQEMENLIEMHLRHEAEHVHPDVEAAWLHHRFTLIHPFTDGNGRVARCLAVLALLKADWLPLVITHRQRNEYISALRSADDGNLKPLVELIDLLQREAIREAGQLDTEAAAIGDILEIVERKLDRQQRDETEQAFEAADSLQALAKGRLEDISQQIGGKIQGKGQDYRSYVSEGRRGSDKARYNHWQITQIAKACGYFADLQRYRAWTALVILTEHRTELLFSFHGIGREAAGILGCSAMVYNKEEIETGESMISEITPLSGEPFTFTYREDPSDMQRRFGHWLDECILKGLNYWQRSL